MGHFSCSQEPHHFQPDTAKCSTRDCNCCFISSITQTNPIAGFASGPTPCTEIRVPLLLDLAFLLLRVGPNPSGFGVLSGGTFIGFFISKKFSNFSRNLILKIESCELNSKLFEYLCFQCRYQWHHAFWDLHGDFVKYGAQKYRDESLDPYGCN